jgi:hypothetical protein
MVLHVTLKNAQITLAGACPTISLLLVSSLQCYMYHPLPSAFEAVCEPSVPASLTVRYLSPSCRSGPHWRLDLLNGSLIDIHGLISYLHSHRIYSSITCAWGETKCIKTSESFLIIIQAFSIRALGREIHTATQATPACTSKSSQERHQVIGGNVVKSCRILHGLIIGHYECARDLDRPDRLLRLVRRSELSLAARLLAESVRYQRPGVCLLVLV